MPTRPSPAPTSARAPADGDTLFFANLPAVVPPQWSAKLPDKGVRGFTPVADVLTLGFMLATSPTVPATSLKEFIALLKADPDWYS